jgi:hypothetical protein
MALSNRNIRNWKSILPVIFGILFYIIPAKPLSAQIAKDESERFDIIGIRPTLKHINLFYQHAIAPNTSVFVDAGYEFRYIKEYERITSLQLGFLPSLASQGVLAETGLILHLNNIDLMLSIQYKFSHIKQGSDYYITVSDGSFEDIYTRDDYKLTAKINWIFNPEDRVQFYLGFGVRGARAYHWQVGQPRNYSALYTWEKQWVVPTAHLGIRIIALRSSRSFQ